NRLLVLYDFARHRRCWDPPGHRRLWHVSPSHGKVHLGGQAMIITLVCLASLAVAQASPPPVDITQTGPLSRRVTKEDRQGIEALFKAADAAWKKGDLQALTALYDFPIYMATDTKDGTFQGGEWSVEQFQKIM